jgi:DNA anti-recombination protein RmuC
MRQSWTDDRLDDLSHRMDERFDQVEGKMKSGFDRVDGEIKELRAEIENQGRDLRAESQGQGKELRAEIKDQGKELRAEMAGIEARLRAQSSEHHVRTGEEFAKVREELGHLHKDKQQMLAGIQALQRTVIQVGWAGAFTLIAAIAGALISRLF